MLVTPQRWIASWAAFFLATAPFSFAAGSFPEPANTQLGVDPISAEAATKSFNLPEGFKVSVFASEPDVRQPIAMTTDSQGRLWVAENYTYGDSKEGYQTNYNDRIVILEDTDHDGHFDKRTVFSDQLKMLTSIEVGMGGVFALCPPRLLFLPMKDGVATGEVEVLLEGFDNVSAGRHTFANGLKWGPDGWLWGRIGISTGAHVTYPHPSVQSGYYIEMRGGIWRFHPRRHKFEPVCHGTTNPWGLDWDEYGEPFFINTVIGHLWHAIPGAHFRRMHGEDVNPHSYQLIDQHADHYHFDTGAGWTKSRAATDGSFAAGSDSLGGGHAHAGLLIYQGDNWPAQYRNKLFTLNLHGRRINQDRLERYGSGYVGRHEPDLLSVGDTWFRGLDLIEGQDGGVFVSDWSDTGECHENDGVHRTSGRIYKITYGTPAKPKVADLATAGDMELVSLVFDHDEWYSRHARMELRDRLGDGRSFGAIKDALLKHYNEDVSTTAKLRALWTFNILEASDPEWLLAQTAAPDEHIRSWAVRLLVDWYMPVYDGWPEKYKTVEKMFARFREMSESDPSSFVRLYLAGALQRLDSANTDVIAESLLQHPEDANDHNLPLLLWYGIEPLIAKDPNLGVILARHSQIPQINTLIARRLAEDLEKHPEPVSLLLEDIKGAKPEAQLPTLYGLSAALQGLRKCTPPAGWNDFATSTRNAINAELHAVVDRLGIVFGDGRPLDDLRTVVTDTTQSPITRRDAIKTLVANRVANLGPLLRSQTGDSFVRAPALVGLLELGETNASAQALSLIKNLDGKERDEVMAALVARPVYASALLESMARGALPKSVLTPFQARQIASLKDPILTTRMGEVWGTVKTTDEAKRNRISGLEKILWSSFAPDPDLSHGRQLFDRTCASCHRLYGQGRDVGPDLTGSGRQHYDYLLNNIVDPNALVPAEYRMSVITLKDGRVLNGIVHPSGDHAITVATPADSVTIDRKEIESTDLSDQSMMPEGLLDGLKDREIRDLLYYLMSGQQVELPGK